MPLEQPPRDDQLLDLVRALADEEQRRVAVVPLGTVLERVAVAAVDAHAVERVVLRRLGREVLRHPGLEVGALARGLLLAPPARSAGAPPRCCVAICASISCTAWCWPIGLPNASRSLRVAERVVERRLRDADAARGDVDAADLDPAHEVLEALADPVLAAEDARGGRAEAVEHELASTRLPCSRASAGRASGSSGPGGLVSGSFSTMKPVIPVCGGSALGIGLREQHDDPASASRSSTHIFWPVITYSSPSRTALVRIACTSEPACGSVIENAARISPEASLGR